MGIDDAAGPIKDAANHFGGTRQAVGADLLELSDHDVGTVALGEALEDLLLRHRFTPSA